MKSNSRTQYNWQTIALIICAMTFGMTITFAQGGGGGGISGTSIDCGETDAFSLGGSGFTGDDPTTATGSCGQCCYAGSDLDGDGDQDVSFSTENGTWYEYCNNTGAPIDIDIIVDETNNDCNLQGAVFVGPTSGNNTIDCSNSENQEYGSNMNGNADGFAFNGVTVPDGECAYIFIDGYAGAACGAATIEIVCPCIPPVVTATASPTTVCSGGSVTLTASGATTYTWSASGGGGGLNSTTGTSVTANPTTTTTYTVTGDDGAGCTADATVTVTVAPDPIPDAGPDQTGCDGDSFIIGADPIYNQEGAGYSWDNSAGSGTLDLAGGQQDHGTATVSPSTTTTYTVTLTDLNGCVGTDQVTITITPPVVPTFDPVPDQCLNDTPPVLPTTSNDGYTGSWSPSTINTSSTGTTTYTFTPDPGQCADNATLDVTVGPPPVPTFDPIADVCIGDAAPSLPTTSNEGITGSWSPAVSTTTSGTTTYTFTPDGGQCSDLGSLDITVIDLPSIDAGNDQLGCDGDVFTIGGDPVYTVSGTPYTWNNGAGSGTLMLSGNPNNQDNGQVDVNPNTTTTYALTITDANGCSNTVDVTVTVDPCVLPIELLYFDASCINTSIIEWRTSTEYNNKYFLLEKSCNEANFELIATIEGEGTSFSPTDYRFIDDSRACDESESTYYRLSQVDFDGTKEILSTISVQCEESGEPLIIESNNSIYIATNKPFTYQLMSLEGKIISSSNTEQKEVTISTQNCQAGFYVIEINSTDRFVKRLFIGK